MNEIYATCSHAVKRIMWEVTIPAYDREGNPGTSHLTVCPKCYQKFYKIIAIEAKRGVIKYWGVEKTGEE